MKQDKSQRGCSAVVLVIILLYIAVSLFHLGNPYAPSTAWNAYEKGETILLDLGAETEIGTVSWYLGNYENRVLEIYVRDEASGDHVGNRPLQQGLEQGQKSGQISSGNSVQTENQSPSQTENQTKNPTETQTKDPAAITWARLPDLEMTRVWQWGTRSVNSRGRFLKLITTNQYTQILELIIKDSKGTVIIPANTTQYPQLFDEAHMDPGRPSFQSGTVFDESYFARTAYEYLHGLRSYEDTHPPFGKLMISPGIACFGMNPFGWRISGVVGGTLLLLMVWAFSLRLIENRRICVLVTALMALDFLHFTESRLGQTDSFLVLSITCMFYFMYRYCEAAEGEQKRWGWLAASGLFFAMAISCKWSGFYGGAGLAVIWLAVVIRDVRIRSLGWNHVWKTCCISVVCFLLLPAAVYLSSYVPYVAADPEKGFLARVAKNQINMFRYHSTLSGSHESASFWYQWPLSLRPVQLFQKKLQGGKQEILVLMGNPGLWWPGAAAMFACFYDAITRKWGKEAFLLTAYGSCFIPWIFISRYTFLYHYYPCVPFMALAMGVWAQRRGRKGERLLLACTVLSGLLFLLFYPVISGMQVNQEYVTRWLQWLPTWKLGAG